jgi:carboxyl-terminal processing protease
MRFRNLLVASVALAVTLLSPALSSQGALPAKDPTPAEMLSLTNTTDGNIAAETADMLQTVNYTQHPFDQEIASRFLDRYLETLDYSHMYFLKSDIAEFEQYRTNLQDLTLRDHDTSPCWKIFARFMERANERITYATNVLATEKFDFSGHDKFVVNRHTLPYPQDMAEARKFWHEELRCEYLDQLVGASDVKFVGPVMFDGLDKITPKIEAISKVELSRSRLHPSSFELLPKFSLVKDQPVERPLTVSANGSNATLTLNWGPIQNGQNATNDIYGESGTVIGDISIYHPKGDTNNPAKLETAIHLKEKDLSEINKALTNHYVQLMQNYKELTRDQVFEYYMNSLARAYDPHSDYMRDITAENFNIQMKLSLFGIGALLKKDGSFCRVDELKEGPAAKSGKMKAGDRIIAVAQTNAEPVDCVGMTLDKVVEMIRGPKGTQVTLTIIPAGADDSVHKEVSLIRDEIRIEDSAVKAKLYEEPKGNGHPAMKLGVIELPSFYADTTPTPQELTSAGGHPTTTHGDVARLIKRLKKEQVNGIVLDLRRNGGGYLDEAIKLTGLFIPRGPVVQTKDPNGDIVTDDCRNATVLYDGPLVILTSRFSASASEIFAGALQDWNRALIVGDHSTFGKGTVQTMQELAPWMDQKHLDYAYRPGSLKVTIKKFYRAGGVSTQLKGVESDIELPSVWNYATDEVGESALPNPLACDEVPTANPENLNRVKPYLAELQQISKQRVAKDRDFEYIQEDITKFRKEEADKSISLNEAERIAEQKVNTAIEEARKKERLARKKFDEKVFDLTLKNVDSPQLEAEAAKTNSVAAATAAVSGEVSLENEPDADAPAQDAPPVDPALTEAKHILADYISMMNKEPVISQTAARQ